MSEQTPKEIFFKELGFGNMNILKLPHTIINMEAQELSKSFDIAISSERERTVEEILNKIGEIDNDSNDLWRIEPDNIVEEFYRLKKYLIGAKPTHRPCEIVHKLKGNTSIQLRRCFPDLRYLGYKQHFGKGFKALWAVQTKIGDFS
jgi:hypothetical protein